MKIQFNWNGMFRLVHDDGTQGESFDEVVALATALDEWDILMLRRKEARHG